VPGRRTVAAPRFVALLRAVNVGGKSPASMAEVRDVLADAFGAVSSIGHAGSLLLEAPSRPRDEVAREIEQVLARRLKLSTTAIVRTSDELRALVTRAPFGAGATPDDEKRYVAFLASRPRSRPRLPLEAPKEGLTLLELVGQDALLLSRRVAGGRSGFPNGLVEKAFGVEATTRNWNTVVKLAEAAVRE
jgi:uncharacterized protein (DUF1697 family)